MVGDGETQGGRDERRRRDVQLTGTGHSIWNKSSQCACFLTPQSNVTADTESALHSSSFN